MNCKISEHFFPKQIPDYEPPKFRSVKLWVVEVKRGEEPAEVSFFGSEEEAEAFKAGLKK